MTYRGTPGSNRNLGIKPTKEDHTKVAAWSLMGIGVRDICARLGEKYNLGKPMSRMTMYWHFRKDLAPNKRGRKLSKQRKNAATPKLKAKVAARILAETQQMIEDASKRANIRKSKREEM